MTNNEIANLLLMVVGLLFTFLLVLFGVLAFIKFKSSKKEQTSNTEKIDSGKSKVQQSYSTQSIFSFMEFEKIEDNMIVQKNGRKFLMVVSCQGINFDLMSAVEKNSVEQGFTQFLNTLRNPIQIYIQTRTVNLTSSINTYKDKINMLKDNLNQKEFEFNRKVRSGNYDNKQLDAQRFEIVKARNLYEYGTDIINNTQRMSLNRNILTKQYFIVLSYYPEEANNSVYSKEEISGIAFSELYTRAQSTISLLSVCGVHGKVLDSNELAELLYTAYNRDEAEVYDLNKAISSGYDSLYTTSQDVLEKKMEELDKQIEKDAINAANEAVIAVKQEREIERQLREKQNDYDNYVESTAKDILDENEDVLGEEVVEEAKQKLVEHRFTRRKSKAKEVEANEQEKSKRTRRTTKSA